MKLYNAGLSPNALRVRAVANELGIAARTPRRRSARRRGQGAGAPDAATRTPRFRCSSMATSCSGRAGRSPPTSPPEAGGRALSRDLRARAIVDQWSYWQAIHLGPAAATHRVRALHEAASSAGRARRGGDRAPAPGGQPVPRGARGRARRARTGSPARSASPTSPSRRRSPYRSVAAPCPSATARAACLDGAHRGPALVAGRPSRRCRRSSKAAELAASRRRVLKKG